MTHTSLKRLKNALITPVLATGAFATQAFAAVYDGPGITGGLDATQGVGGLNTGDPRQAIIGIINAVLSFLALAAVIMIIIAGIYLIFSFGNEETKDKAKRIIIYTLIGLVVVLFARIIVSLITVFLASQV